MKNRIFGSLGSSFEWFDFALYGFFGPIFSRIFFSDKHQSQLIGLIVTYGIFAIGYAARPIGALIFGYIGDKFGRVLSLKLTAILITLTTIILASLPTYASIGNLATLFLLFTRIIQGVLLGGEYAGNIVYLYESSKKWKYFWGSIGSCTASLGILLASSVATYFYRFNNHSFLFSYGWRIAYLISVPFGVLVYLMRAKMPETKEFCKVNIDVNPFLLTFKKYKSDIVYSLGLIFLHCTSFYFVFIFIPIFLIEVRHSEESAALLNNSIFLMLHLLFIPVFGILINFIGGIRANVIISLLFSFLCIPIFYFISFGSNIQLFVSLMTFSVLTAANAAIIPALIAEFLPSHVRYTILGLTLNLGFGIFGGSMTFIALMMIKNGWNIMSPSYYLCFSSIVTFVVGYNLLLRNGYETKQIPST